MIQILQSNKVTFLNLYEWKFVCLTWKNGAPRTRTLDPTQVSQVLAISGNSGQFSSKRSPQGEGWGGAGEGEVPQMIIFTSNLILFVI